MPNAAEQSCIALSSIASNTGARLSGEQLMTCSTSAVAVCWVQGFVALGGVPPLEQNQ